MAVLLLKGVINLNIDNQKGNSPPEKSFLLGEQTHLEKYKKHESMVAHYSNPENLADFLGVDGDLTLVGKELTLMELFGIDRRLAPDLVFKAERKGKTTYYIGEVKINEKLRKSALSRATSYHMVLNNNRIENVPFVIAGSVKQFLKRME